MDENRQFANQSSEKCSAYKVEMMRFVLKAYKKMLSLPCNALSTQAPLCYFRSICALYITLRKCNQFYERVYHSVIDPRRHFHSKSSKVKC
jgi:hypothetical protein